MTPDRAVIAIAGAAAIVAGAVIVASLARRRVADPRNRTRLAVLIGVVALGTVALFEARALGGHFGHLTLAAGIVSAGVAFAAQEVIVSVAGWLTILFAHFYRIGDRVELGGIRGDVIEIGVLRTRLMEIGQWVHSDLYNGRVVLVANSFVFKEPVFNYSGEFPFVWDELVLPIRYDSDLARARALVDRVVRDATRADTDAAREAWSGMLARYRIESARLEPMVTLVANDNWVEFTARYVVSYRFRRARQDQIFTRLVEEIHATGGAVAIASATQQIVSPSTIDVVVHPNGGAA